MEVVEINGAKRDSISKSECRNLRRNDKVPCVLYGTDENIHFYANEFDFRKLIYEPGLNKANINVNGDSFEAILKEAQFHPVTDKLLHVDFLVLNAGTKVITEIPVKLVGSSIGVKEGGRLNLNIRKLKVKGLPKDLQEYIEVDVSDLDIGKSIKVRDIDYGELEVLTVKGSPIAAVEIPRALKSVLGEDEVEEGEEGEEDEEGEEGADGTSEEGSGDTNTQPAEGGKSPNEG